LHLVQPLFIHGRRSGRIPGFGVDNGAGIAVWLPEVGDRIEALMCDVPAAARNDGNE
jgi:hypothetical protein